MIVEIRRFNQCSNIEVKQLQCLVLVSSVRSVHKKSASDIGGSRLKSAWEIFNDLKTIQSTHIDVLISTSPRRWHVCILWHDCWTSMSNRGKNHRPVALAASMFLQHKGPFIASVTRDTIDTSPDHAWRNLWTAPKKSASMIDSRSKSATRISNALHHSYKLSQCVCESGKTARSRRK